MRWEWVDEWELNRGTCPRRQSVGQSGWILDFVCFHCTAAAHTARAANAANAAQRNAMVWGVAHHSPGDERCLATCNVAGHGARQEPSRCAPSRTRAPSGPPSSGCRPHARHLLFAVPVAAEGWARAAWRRRRWCPVLWRRLAATWRPPLPSTKPAARGVASAARGLTWWCVQLIPLPFRPAAHARARTHARVWTPRHPDAHARAHAR